MASCLDRSLYSGERGSGAVRTGAEGSGVKEHQLICVESVIAEVSL